MGDIEPAFDDVLAFMKSESAASPSQDQMLSMYALYKQASAGDCEGTRPGLLDVVARAKYDAWAALRGTPAPEAMQRYILAAIALDPAAAGPAGNFATAPSTSTSPSAATVMPPPTASSTDVDDAGALATAFKPFGRLEQWSSRAPWAIFPRKRLEASFNDLGAGLWACLATRDTERQSLIHRIETFWSTHGDAFVCLSVRTGFDLALQCLQLEPGSEVVCTAITIRDMVRVVEEHGLHAVPADVGVGSLQPTEEALERAITPRSKVLLVVHLFGARVDLDAAHRVAQRHGLLLIEDCAEAFRGPEYRGDDRADISMFSFGTIKTSTAFGGALFRFRDASLLQKVRVANERLPVRPRAVFAKRLAKYAVLHGASTPAVFGAAVRVAQAAGVSHDDVITDAIRGFAGGDFFTLIRQRPSTPLLALLWRRLSSYEENDGEYVDRRRARCELVAGMLEPLSGVAVPGSLAASHAYWLFPVVVADPQRVMDHMLENGFDVTQGATQLGSLDNYVTDRTASLKEGAGEEGASWGTSHAMMEQLVYLPVTAEMPLWAVHRMVHELSVATKGTVAPMLSRL